MNAELHLEKAKCYKKLEHYHDMKESALRAHQLDGQSSETLLNLGIALIETGKRNCENSNQAILDIDAGISNLSSALTIATREHEQAGG